MRYLKYILLILLFTGTAYGATPDRMDYTGVSNSPAPTIVLTKGGTSIYTDPSNNGLFAFIDERQMLLSGNTWQGLRAVDNTTYSTGATKTGYNPITGLIQDYSATKPVIAYLREGDTKSMAGFDVNDGVSNYVKNSTVLTAADWLYTRSGVTNKGTAPDGTETAYFLAADGSDGSHFVRDAYADGIFANNTMINRSIYVQASTINWINVAVQFQDNSTANAYYNLSTGVMGTTSGLSSFGISKDTYNGAYRIWLSLMSDSSKGGVSQFLTYLAEADNDISFQSDGSGVTIWGPMVSQTAWLPPYIPTDSAIALYTGDSGNPYFGMPPVMSDALAEVLGGELSTNWNMEGGPPDGWEDNSSPTSSGLTTAQAYSGTTSWFFVKDSSDDGVRTATANRLSVTSGNLYKVSVRVYPDDGTTIGFLSLGGSTILHKVITGLTQDAWNLIELYMEPTVDSASAYVAIYGGTGKTFVDDFSLKQVTNARISDKVLWPPHGEVEVYWVPYYDYGDMIGQNGLITVTNSAPSLLYLNASVGIISSFDGTTVASKFTVNWPTYRLYKLVMQFGYLDANNISRFRVGVDSGSGISWSADTKYDGSFTTGGNGLQLFYTGFGRSKIGPIRMWNRIRSDAEINAEGSP